MRAVPPEDAEAPGPSWKRLVWFLAIAAGSAGAAARDSTTRVPSPSAAAVSSL